MLGLYIANFVAILKTFICLNYCRGNIAVVNYISTVMCFKELHLFSINLSLIKSIELYVKPKMFALFCNALLESKYED